MVIMLEIFFWFVMEICCFVTTKSGCCTCILHVIVLHRRHSP